MSDKITVEMIMEKKPCMPDYPESRVIELIGDGKMLLELLDLPIPEKDRIWAVTRFLSDHENRKFAIWCARRANINNVPEITAYIDAIEAYYIAGTGTKGQMVAAGWAAYRVADRAADRAAYWVVERQKQIAYFADTAMKLAGIQEPLPKHEPVWLTLYYFLQRPQSHYGTGGNVGKLKPSAPKHHVTKPDIDKLERAVKDALTGVVYTDDSQVVHTTHGKDYGDKPGVRITIETRNGNEPF